MTSAPLFCSFAILSDVLQISKKKTGDGNVVRILRNLMNRSDSYSTSECILLCFCGMAWYLQSLVVPGRAEPDTVLKESSSDKMWKGDHMNTAKKISIIGSGTMGSGIAVQFALHGMNVSMNDIDAACFPKAKERIREALELLSSQGVIRQEEIAAAEDRITFSTGIAETVTGTELVIESIVEDLEKKQECFRQLDELCDPSVILASNTSVISITEIGEKCRQRERIIGTHFWNPPFVLPLVEVVKTGWVSDETVERTCRILREAGKKPVVVRKDVPGFLANRLSIALMREAFHIIQEGIAEPEDIDMAINNSFGLRLSFTGPVGTSDYCGLDMTSAIQNYLYPSLSKAEETKPWLLEKISKQELGFKSGKGILEWSETEQKEYKKELVENVIRICKALNRF